MGVKIEADNRYAVNTHVTVLWDVCRSCWIVDRTGNTSDCRSAYADTPKRRTVKVAR
jgi:hypothetical protein